MTEHHNVHTVRFLNYVQLDYSVLCCGVSGSQHTEPTIWQYYNPSKCWEPHTQWQYHTDLNLHNYKMGPAWLGEWLTAFHEDWLDIAVKWLAFYGRYRVHHDWGSNWSLPVPPCTHQASTEFRPWLLPSTSFLIHYLVIIPSLDITASAVHHTDHIWINQKYSNHYEFYKWNK
jgi:hypothetical protein